MKKLLNILAVAVVTLVVGSCSSVKDIRISSCSIKSVSLNGLKSVKAMLSLGIDNPIMAFTISDLQGVINNNGTELATFSAGKLPVQRKSSKVYPLSCDGTIGEQIGLIDLMRLAGSRDFSGMTVDLSLRIKLRCGLGKTLKFKNLKVSDMMEPKVAAAYIETLIDEMAI